jgi:hypothetical protein
LKDLDPDGPASRCIIALQAKTLDPFRFVLIAVAGWMNPQRQDAIDYLRQTCKKATRAQSGADNVWAGC